MTDDAVESVVDFFSLRSLSVYGGLVARCYFLVDCLLLFFFVFHCFFFFQAEDGIRDLVRSRGLGDVYKRQVYANVDTWLWNDGSSLDSILVSSATQVFVEVINSCGSNYDTLSTFLLPVSYTHLTLPTSDLV